MQLTIGVQGTHGWTRRAAMALALCTIAVCEPASAAGARRVAHADTEPNAAAANAGRRRGYRSACAACVARGMLAAER